MQTLQYLDHFQRKEVLHSNISNYNLKKAREFQSKDLQSLSTIVRAEEGRKGFELHDKYKRMKDKLSKNREGIDEVMSRAYRPKKINYDLKNGRLITKEAAHEP
jgi:hypothetical protein